MKRSQLGLVGRRVCTSLWARLWTHVLTAGTMAIALFVFGAFLLVQENLQNLLTGWGDQIQINAYLDKDLRAEEVALLRDKIQSLSEVERIRHISREQAWKDFQAALGAHSNVLEGLPEDVLPASFEIFIKPAYRDGPIVEAFANRLRKAKGTYHRRVFPRMGRQAKSRGPRAAMGKVGSRRNPFRRHLFYRPEHGATSDFSAEG